MNVCVGMRVPQGMYVAQQHALMITRTYQLSLTKCIYTRHVCSYSIIQTILLSYNQYSRCIRCFMCVELVAQLACECLCHHDQWLRYHTLSMLQMYVAHVYTIESSTTCTPKTRQHNGSQSDNKGQADKFVV
jgi:hypothetical protein